MLPESLLLSGKEGWWKKWFYLSNLQILGNMKEDPQSLMLVTLVNSLQRLGYVFKIYTVEHGKARSIWRKTLFFLGGTV
ncbi:hypothetical protein HRI_000420300 [Hibiscus trionum]|uniref:Uncharacterized protein n=1 Tax=Hibiscus trionum TaxID=183268 RepID=A0A9W7H122_HIBTR|nr:hypothetical protein HRI_000420300 [Hibiscus trionum]